MVVRLRLGRFDRAAFGKVLLLAYATAVILLAWRPWNLLLIGLCLCWPRSLPNKIIYLYAKRRKYTLQISRRSNGRPL